MTRPTRDLNAAIRQAQENANKDDRAYIVWIETEPDEYHARNTYHATPAQWYEDDNHHPDNYICTIDPA